MKLSKIANDTGKENEWQWSDVPGFPGVRIEHRSARNADHKRLYNRLLVEYRAQLSTQGQGAIDASEEIDAIVLRKADLRNWEGVDGDDGNPISFEAGADAIFGTGDGKAAERKAARRRYADFILACRQVVANAAAVDRSLAEDDDDEEPTEADAEAGKASTPS